MSNNDTLIDVSAAASLGGEGGAEVAIEAAALAVMAIDPALQPYDGEPGEWLRLTDEMQTRIVTIQIGSEA